MTELALHRPAVLGHSMGGATALVLAGTYPELPGPILVEDAGAFGMRAPERAQADEEQRVRSDRHGSARGSPD
jgi:pimeloyl-ACP methyl ester carboxylesterase